MSRTVVPEDEDVPFSTVRCPRSHLQHGSPVDRFRTLMFIRVGNLPHLVGNAIETLQYLDISRAAQ